MLLRILLIAFLLTPSYASWYPKTKVSCEPDYEKEVPNRYSSKIVKVEFQGYENIILFIFLGVSVIIYTIYTLKSRNPNFLLELVHGFSYRRSRVMFKSEKEASQENKILVPNDEKCIPEDAYQTSSRETVSPPNMQPYTDHSPPQVLPEENRPMANDSVENIVSEEQEREELCRVPSYIPHSVEENLNTSDEANEMLGLEQAIPCLRKDIGMKQRLSENNKGATTPEHVDYSPLARNYSPAAGKSKIPEMKPSSSKGTSGTKPQNLSKNPLGVQKSGKKPAETMSHPSKNKSSTESLSKRQGRKESSGSVKLNVTLADEPCRCESAQYVEKLAKETEILKKETEILKKETEILKKRITAAEKAKREAIRDSDIQQKSMVSLKTAVKAASEENEKLKKQLEVAKRDKTEAVRRITAKWREKISQLEERMRIDAEEASNKAESVSSNVASSSGKIKPDMEEVPQKPASIDSSRFCRWNFKPVAEDSKQKEQRVRHAFNYRSETPGGWVDEEKCEDTGEGETDQEVDSKCEAQETYPEVADLTLGISQMPTEDIVDDFQGLQGKDAAQPAAVADSYPKEDEWQDDDEYDTGKGDNDTALREIISEATARLDALRVTEVLEEQITVSHSEGSTTPSDKNDSEGRNLEEVAEEPQKGDVTDEVNEESPMKTEDTTTPLPLAAPALSSAEKEKATSSTEVSQMGGRLLRLRTKKKDSNTSVEISIVGKKSHTEEGFRSKLENELSSSKSKSSISKYGLTSKNSDKKICKSKPPVPKSSVHRIASKNEFDLTATDTNADNSLSYKTTQAITVEASEQQMNAYQIQAFTITTEHASYTKVPKSVSDHDIENTETTTGETNAKKVNETAESDVEAVSNENKETLGENQQAEQTVTEVLHSSMNYWTEFEEENHCNVVDESSRKIETNKDEMQSIDAQLKESNVDDTGNTMNETAEDIATQKLTAREMFEEMANAREEENDENQENIFSINADLPGQSMSDMELEARNYIQDLINLSASFTEEEKEAVEELLGQCFPVQGLLQNLSSMPSLNAESPRETLFPKSGSNDVVAPNTPGRLSGHSSFTSTAAVPVTENQGANTGASNSVDSLPGLGRGFLTGKLKQCFIYDPEKVNEQNTDALKNFMKMVGARTPRDKAENP